MCSEIKAWTYKTPGCKEHSQALIDLRVRRGKHTMVCPSASICNPTLLLRLHLVPEFVSTIFSRLKTLNLRLNQALTCSKLAEGFLIQPN